MHAGIDAAQNPFRTRGFGKGFEGTHQGERQAGTKSQPLRHTTSNAQSSERPRTAGRGETGQLREAQVLAGEHFLHHGQEMFAMSLGRWKGALLNLAVAPKRNGTNFCRSIERQDQHGSDFTAASLLKLPVFRSRGTQLAIAVIESLDQEGRGITRLEGKTIFVEGALPGETVEFSSYRKKPNYELAQVERVLRSSSQRVTPRCPHFGVCGGCSMQHLEPRAQVAVKQRVLEDALWHLGRVRPQSILPAIEGPAWGYRQRARLSVRHVAKKGGVLVGFHEKRSSYVADMKSCAVLPPAISDLLLPLRELVAALSIRDRLPQIEVAVGRSVSSLVLRILEPLSAADEALLRRFADRHGVCFDLQPKGPDSVVRLHPAQGSLDYVLPEFGLSLPFRPTDFTQVNASINRVLVRRALALLGPRAGERVVDLFCGLGNFTLPIAACGARVLGIEGNETLVARARANAASNGLAGRCELLAANLFEPSDTLAHALAQADRLLIDPPREGAIAVVKALEEQAPRRIVYVSCNPATLARDAAVLVHEKAYRLEAAGVVNMFPHTAHVESIACFERV